MFGNLVNNRQLLKLLEERQLTIEPFNEKELGTANYPLRARRILNRQPDGKWVQGHNFEDDPNPFDVPANGYVIVEAREAIKLNTDGLLGNFLPASNLIEQGFSVVCGKMDKKYGTTCGELLRFGLKNMLPESNRLTATDRIVHVQFYDLRSLANLSSGLSEEEIKIRIARAFRQRDDGMYYDEKD